MTAESYPRPRILIVDDKAENLLALEALLEDVPGDPDIQKASSGNEALRLCLDFEMALVLMDVQMPGMDGYETVSLLRRNTRTRLLPVILISAIYREEIWLTKGIESGAVDFIPKPIVPEILRGKVKIFLELHKAKIEQEHYAAQLRESEERFRAIFEQADDSISLIDPELGRIVEFNEPTCRNLGYTRQQFMQLKISDFQICTSPQEDTEIIRRIIKDGGAVYETRHRTRDGEIRHIHVHSKMITIGQRVYVQNIWRDITALKRMEDQLRRSNSELEHFAYAASHDLKEPLRGIFNFVSLITDRYSKELPEKVTEYLERIAGAAMRLQAMIENLLAYSHIDRNNEPFQPVGATEVVADALSSLKVLICEKGAKISCGELPRVVGDRLQLGLVFQNLLGNSLKFCEAACPRVRISARDLGDCWQFEVRDNGIGIEAAYLEQVFELFQRMHSRRKYEGSGMGLAIVSKIIRRHGGSVWMESSPDQGSTVFFTLPKTQPGGKE